MNDEQIDSVFEQGPQMPAELSEKIRSQIQRDTQAVRPLMNPVAYGLIFAAIAGGVGFFYAVLSGTAGMHALTQSTAVAVLAVLSALIFTGSWMVARSMRPASGSLYSWGLAILTLAAYEALVFGLFRSYSTAQFFHQGLVCLSIGVGCGLLTALTTWMIVRRGLIVQPVQSGAVIGLISGLAGLVALTLHCPVVTTPHAGVWHAAVIVVCVCAGAIAGRVLQRR